MKNKLLAKKIVFASFLAFLSVALFFLLFNETNVNSNDILSLKRTDATRTQVTVLVKYAFSINNFEKIVEEKFPDIDLVQVGNFTSNTVLAREYKARLEHDDLTDIVITWPLDIGPEYWHSRLIDMSGMPFTSRYKTAMLDSIATGEGNLYYLPGPAQIRALVYNKTLFEENGWTVPKNYTEFLELCKTIQSTGMRSLQLSLGNPEVLDTAFILCSYGSAFSKSADIEWYKNYQNGRGIFLDHFGDSLETFQELIDNDILQESDLGLYYHDTQKNLFTRKTAMIEDSVMIISDGKNLGYVEDEYALMPFFNKSPQSDWARIYMTAYIGLNKHLQEKENANKYSKALKLMDFISTYEGQKALSSDNPASFSSLKNFPSPNIPEISLLIPTLEQGRYGIFPNLGKNGTALRQGLAGMVRKTTTALQVARMTDKENIDSTTENTSEIYGKASEDFTLIETGNFFTDVMKETADTDIALFLDNGKDGKNNQKGISAKIYGGDITEIDLSRIFPDLQNLHYSELIKITMTGENLIKTLEYTIEPTDDKGYFYYFSGLEMSFDPFADPGSRISNLQMTDGTPIKSDTVYSVAVMPDTFPAEYAITTQNLGVSIKNLVAKKIQALGIIYPSNDERFKIVTSYEQ